MTPKPILLATKLLGILCLFGIASACGRLATAPKRAVEAPDVAVLKLSLDAFSPRSVAGQIAFEVKNSSQVAMALRYVEWEMSVEGEKVTGRTDLAQLVDIPSIPAKGTLLMDTVIEVMPMDAERVAPHLGSGERISTSDGRGVSRGGYPVDYTIKGVLHFETEKGEVAVDFASAGKL